MIHEAVKCKVSKDNFDKIISLAIAQGYGSNDSGYLTLRKTTDYFENLILTYDKKFGGDNYNNGYNDGYIESGNIIGYNHQAFFDCHKARLVREYELIYMLSVGHAEYLENKAVDYLAKQMKQRLKEKRLQGYGGWTNCDKAIMLDGLNKSVGKGNSIDVANYCALLLARNDTTNNLDNSLPKLGEAVKLKNLSDVQLEKFSNGEDVVIHEIWGSDVHINNDKYFSKVGLDNIEKV